MRLNAICLVAVAGLAAETATAACEIPSLVRAIPDGATATEEELLAAQAEVQAYIAAMDAYIACENEAIEVGGEDATAQFLTLMGERIASARSEADAVALRFNDQVRAFRAARPVSTVPPRSGVLQRTPLPPQ